MEETQVVEWIDIQAPRHEIFEIITNLQRRLQLSPLWGVAKVERVDQNYPQEGSQYQTCIGENGNALFTTVITALVPLRKFSYCTLVDRETKVCWMLQDVVQGTRLTYVEEYCADEGDGEEFVQTMHKIIKDWLANIKRYAELRETRFQQLMRWLMDRYYLKMRPDQRRTVQAVLFMHAVGMISFVMAALAYGFATLFI